MRSSSRRSLRALLVPLALVMLISGCATLQQIAALRQVDFSLDRLSRLELAGVRLDDKRSYGDLGVADVTRLTLALAEGRLPLAFNLDVQGENPADNAADARLVRFDWTLLLDDRETVSGVFADEVVFRPGEPTTFPVQIELDLLEFFEGSARDLGELALSLTGQGGAPKNVALRAVPTVNTALGPIRYPGAITVLSTRVGPPAPTEERE